MPISAMNHLSRQVGPLQVPGYPQTGGVGKQPHLMGASLQQPIQRIPQKRNTYKPYPNAKHSNRKQQMEENACLLLLRNRYWDDGTEWSEVTYCGVLCGVCGGVIYAVGMDPKMG